MMNMMYLFLFNCWIAISFGKPLHVVRNRSLRGQVRSETHDHHTHDHTSENLPFKKQKCDDDSTDVQNAHDGHATSLPSTTLDNAPSHSIALDTPLLDSFPFDVAAVTSNLFDNANALCSLW